MIKEYLRRSRVVISLRITIAKIQEALLLSRYIANGNRKDPSKMHTDLFIRMHAIEKGMSIGNVKPGFGQAKVLSLLVDLRHYLSIGGDMEFVHICTQVINKYLQFNHQLNVDMKRVQIAFDSFCKDNSIVLTSINPGCGIILKSVKETKATLNAPFSIFSQSRFSIRDFGNDTLDLGLIHKALKISERTPSACNRQSWKIYVITDKQKRDCLYKLQLGCKGFTAGMQVAVLICGDIRGYNINELHQVYVDGGLYAMNMLYALHSEGLATIPLTMAHQPHHTVKIQRAMDIPDYIIPVLLIGVGTYKNNYRVAYSKRKSYQEYTEFR